MESFLGTAQVLHLLTHRTTAHRNATRNYVVQRNSVHVYSLYKYYMQNDQY